MVIFCFIASSAGIITLPVHSASFLIMSFICTSLRFMDSIILFGSMGSLGSLGSGGAFGSFGSLGCRLPPGLRSPPNPLSSPCPRSPRRPRPPDLSRIWALSSSLSSSVAFSHLSLISALSPSENMPAPPSRPGLGLLSDRSLSGSFESAGFSASVAFSGAFGSAGFLTSLGLFGSESA